MASTYSELLRDPRWQRKRLCVMQRDNFTCRDCAATDKTLNVHHCFYEPRQPPWATDDRFLLTLCEECHGERGGLEADAKRALAYLLAASKPADLLLLVEQLVGVAGVTDFEKHRLIVTTEEWEPTP